MNTVRVVNVYARTPPDEKLRLVRALRTNGDIVAMTGDGVNDAPALKAAHIGIAMGRRGADVAREAAALVLLNDDFSALVAGVGVGRRIYENIRNAMSYLLAVHIPLAGMGLLPLLFGWPLLLFPLHVVFLEFVIDPACSLVFETEHRGAEVMRRPPRDPRQRLFSRPMVLESAALGVTSLVATVLVYGGALLFLPPDEARALGFVTLVAGNLMLILVNRSRDDSLVTVLTTAECGLLVDLRARSGRAGPRPGRAAGRRGVRLRPAAGGRHTGCSDPGRGSRRGIGLSAPVSWPAGRPTRRQRRAANLSPWRRSRAAMGGANDRGSASDGGLCPLAPRHVGSRRCS